MGYAKKKESLLLPLLLLPTTPTLLLFIFPESGRGIMQDFRCFLQQQTIHHLSEGFLMSTFFLSEAAVGLKIQILDDIE